VKIVIFDHPTHLTPLLHRPPANIRIKLTLQLGSLGYIFAADSMGKGSENIASEISENRHFRPPHSFAIGVTPFEFWGDRDHANFSGWLRNTRV